MVAVGVTLMATKCISHSLPGVARPEKIVQSLHINFKIPTSETFNGEYETQRCRFKFDFYVVALLFFIFHFSFYS